MFVILLALVSFSVQALIINENNIKDMQNLLIKNGAINHITGTTLCH